MAFEYQAVSTPPNTSVTVSFNEDVVSYVAGISYYYFTYGNIDHHIGQLALKLDTTQPQANQVTVHVTGILNDSSGHHIDSSASRVDVVVLAYTGKHKDIVLQARSGVPNNGQSEPISLPSPTLSALQAVLSGFNLAYEGDHNVFSESTGVSAQQNRSTAYIVGQAAMTDSSGNEASVATVDGGLIAIATGAKTNVEFHILGTVQTTQQQSVIFSKPLDAACVFMINSQVAYSGSDHHVEIIGAGPSGWSFNRSTVTLDNAFAFMSDASGNTQDNSKSNVSLLVVGFHSS